MAITQSQYTAPDKVQGDIFYSSEHNEMKTVLNQKTDADNTILIEGDQTIDGNLTMNALSATTGAFSDQVTISRVSDHIQLVSTRTDGNTSLDRTALLMAKADSGLDFYLYSSTDAAGKFYVSSTGSGWFANQLTTDGRITIAHREVTDDPKALVISSGTTATTTPTDIVWSRDSKEGARIRFNDKFDMYLSVMNNSNLLTSRIGLGSQRGTGLTHGVTLYEGDTGVKSLHTINQGIVIPSAVEDNTGVVIRSVTTTGRGGIVASNSGSIFFKESSDGKYGMSFDYYGTGQTDTDGRVWADNRLYLNRFDNTVNGKPILHVSKTDSNIGIYGDIWAVLPHVTTEVETHKLFIKNYGWAHNNGTVGKMLIQMDGTLILAAGDAAGGTIATNIGTPKSVYLAADGSLVFYSNLDTGWSGKKSMIFNNAGNLTVDGIVYATNFQFTSDITLKENVKPLNTSIDVDFIEFNFEGSDTKRYGVSAQDVQAVLPELVSKDGEGNLTVAMVDFLILKVAELEKKVKELTK
jgi:hypothetical protein